MKPVNLVNIKVLQGNMTLILKELLSYENGCYLQVKNWFC